MNISNLLNKIKGIADCVKTVRSSYDGDVYTIWNTSEVKYASFVVAVRSVVSGDNVKTYNLVLYYGDRLMSSGRNKNSIWDDATNTIQSVVNKLSDLVDCEVGEYTIECFEQKFEDYLAGAYANLAVEVENELGECEINDIITDDETLIEKLEEAIRKYEEENYELSIVLKEILYKITGDEQFRPSEDTELTKLLSSILFKLGE